MSRAVLSNLFLMANEVIKRDGSREAFSEEKIRNAIRAASQEAGLAEDRVNQLVDQIVQTALQTAAAKNEIATSEIAEIILRELDSVEPAAAAAWRRHDQSAGKT